MWVTIWYLTMNYLPRIGSVRCLSKLSPLSSVPLLFLFKSRGEGSWKQAKGVAKQYDNS